jgi:hypothetical protein
MVLTSYKTVMSAYDLNKYNLRFFKNLNLIFLTTVLVIVHSLRLRDQRRFETWFYIFLQVKWGNLIIYSDGSFRNSRYQCFQFGFPHLAGFLA